MTYAEGKYHLFFQKNGNGPYMARLNWGHIESSNLYDWTEVKEALVPGDWFDIKGCWSGAVFTDKEITGGKPNIIYTGVDYGKAMIIQAVPTDASLLNWQKGSAPIIEGRPDGLSDDFRDPYFFRNGSNVYIIVGSSKNGVGTTTLHTYNPSTKKWSNDGKTSFTGSNAGTAGTFWEMPNVTKIGDKWLFTATPLNTSRGVATLYWVGDINADGTFNPIRNIPGNIEFSGFAKDGYGLLSPTIYQLDGKTIVLGIVPDKLPGNDNYNMGYAHTYSLPREWTLDADNFLVQKPFSGLRAMRDGVGFSKENFILSGDEIMTGVESRAVEVIGEFVVGTGKCGFKLLDDGKPIEVYYDGSRNEIVVDFHNVDRLKNDDGPFNGVYTSSLPKQLGKGSVIKLNVFFDHSIIDIFVNDTWASSVRVFPKQKSREDVTVFAEGSVEVKSVKGWNLNTKAMAVKDLFDGENKNVVVYGSNGYVKYTGLEGEATINVYNLTGATVFNKIVSAESDSFNIASKGLHIVTINTNAGLIRRKVFL